MGFKKIYTLTLRVLIFVLAAALFSQSVVTALPKQSNKANVDSEISKLRGQLEHVGKQEKAETESYLRLRAERIVADNELASLNNKIRAAEQRQAKAQELAAKAREEFAAAQAKLDQAEKEKRQAQEQRQRAIVNLYHGSSNTEVEPSVLGAEPEERQEVVRKKIFLKKYNDSQVEAIKSAGERAGEAILERLAHEDARKRAEEAEAQAASEAELLEPLKAELAEKRKVAKDKEAAEQAVVKSLQAKKASYNKEINQLVAESNRLAAEIRRQQQQQQQQNNNNGNNNGGGSTVTTPAPTPGKMIRPVGGAITSPYGYRTHPIYGDSRLHAGIDFRGGHGTPIKAAKNGKVIVASFLNGYGNTLIVDHGGGVSTLYAHQSSFAVGNGANVTQGQVIGYVGATGNVTGPHLHWEVRLNGNPVNPMPYL